MEKETKQPKEEPNKQTREEYEQDSNSLIIGDIRLASVRLDLPQMADLVVALLKNPEIKSYLDLIKTKRKYSPAYVGGDDMGEED